MIILKGSVHKYVLYYRYIYNEEPTTVIIDIWLYR